MTERTSDEQIAEWRTWVDGISMNEGVDITPILDALAVERSIAEELKDQHDRAEFCGDWAIKSERVLDALWKSRRMYQTRAELQRQFKHNRVEELNREIAHLEAHETTQREMYANCRKERAEARTWAAWFAAERDWQTQVLAEALKGSAMDAVNGISLLNVATGRIDAVRALMDEWERDAGPGSKGEEAFGPQKVSVKFAVQMVRQALDGVS